LQTDNIFAVIENNDCTLNCIKFSNITSLLHTLKDVLISKHFNSTNRAERQGF